MADPIKQLFKTFIADSLVKSFAPDSEDSMYLFTSRPLPWTGTGIDDSNPPDYSDNTDSHYNVWNNMIAEKRITSAEVLLMVKKNAWTYGTIYSTYDSGVDMFINNQVFYVTNTENNVYKCLYNKNSAKSTDSPRGAQTESITTSDGYVWKFMFRIPENIQTYITDDYIPVRNLLVEPGFANKYSDDRFLQYAAQYYAVDGAIDYINVINGGIYQNVIITNTGTGQHTMVQSATANTATLNFSDASSVGDAYIGYVITIKSGLGVGQTRSISAYNASTQTVTITSDWETIPDSTSYYEIMPKVVISGDGISAEATASVINPDTNELNSITVVDGGSSYKRARAVISTTGSLGSTLDVMISPQGGHSSNPANELSADRIMVIARLSRDEYGTFPVINDFRQYGIIKNPIINTGYIGAGGVAGSEVDIFSDIKIKSATSENFNSESFNEGDIVFGTETYTAGKVENWSRSTDITRGILKLRNVYGDFKTNEKVIGVDETTTDLWTSAGKNEGYVEFQDDAYLSQSSNNYRLSTRLVIGASAGMTQDLIVTGSSLGSTGSVISYTLAEGGSTAELLVTGIHRNGTADVSGFTTGEFISGATIDSIALPQFVEGSGTILHINNVTPITRHYEQEEELRIIIDL